MIVAKYKDIPSFVRFDGFHDPRDAAAAKKMWRLGMFALNPNAESGASYKYRMDRKYKMDRAKAAARVEALKNGKASA